MHFSLHFNKRLAVLLHALGWSIILLIPQYLISTYGGSHSEHFLHQFYFNAAIYGSIFYLNYLWLVPKYFIGENKLLYFILAILVVVALYFVTHYVNELVFHDSEHEKEMARLFAEMNKGKEEVRPPIRQFKIYNYFSTAALVTGFSLGLGVLQQLSKNEKKRKELEKEKLNSELAFLKSQVSPHFFFNTLNNIYTLIGIDTKEAQDAILKLSKLMRYLLYESEGGSPRLQNEVDFMNHYIDLMKLRISSKVELRVALPDKAPDISIAPLLFIAFVENAFKHGISYREPSFIEIKMDADEKKIHFETRNSIRKGSSEGEAKYSGIGLENVKKRLNLLYPGKHELKISRTNDAFVVKLEINL